MKQQEPNPAPAKDQPEGSRENVKKRAGEFRSDPKVDGKNDSGPEPEVHNREIPPQE